MASIKATSLSYLRWLLLLPIPALWCVLGHTGWLDSMENYTLALRYRNRGEIEAPVKVRYVDIDTRAIQYLGERPWDRSEFGKAAQVLLETGHAKAVGFDLVFSDLAMSKMVSRADLQKRNLEFARVIRAHPEIVLGAQYSGGQAQIQEGQRQFPLLRRGFTNRAKNDLPELPQYPLLGPTWGTAGLIDVDYGYGRDAAPRWVPLFAQTPNPTFYHLALKLALINLGLPDSAVRIGAQQLDLVRPGGDVAVSIPLREGQLMEINWFSTWGNTDFDVHTSLADVLLFQKDLTSEKEHERREAQRYFEDFQNATVLIGPTDPLLQDLGPTPIEAGLVPKVSAHVNALKTILAGAFLTRFPESATVAITFALTMLVSAFAAAGGVKGTLSKLTAALLLTAYVFFAFWFFKQNHLVLPMALPLCAAFTTSFSTIIWQLIEEEKQKGRIKGMFGAYVSPQLVERMVASGDDPQLGGHDAEITAYFSDIQSFSTFSEKLGSGPLVELMNEYLTACTDIVQEQGGTLDKYIGDAVVAMFGAPIPLVDHAYRACVATQLVHRKLGELREKWQAEGGKWPEIVWNMQSRIGLNSGVCMIGNMGSRTRFNYTMMGDNVNLAARMESGAKQWGVYTMCTEATKALCEKHGGDRVVFRPLGRIVVKGRTTAVPIFEIVGLKEVVTHQMRECVEIFAGGMEKFYARDWDGALRLFNRSRDAEYNIPGQTPGVIENPSLVYLRITEHYKHEPPAENWNGVYVMKEK